ncbi:hypothetical protein P171DRAFT_489124 [Karstenula rhodostoma CBS 690.94]|uniref:RING-type domain-containing protein n=1 Tax=Karstenula rhodostoma CBS 690.94 TaxID=1392251 RepID=A0A9P4P8J7_9PLEO|nr:hypothetical protein P171DRAFT_489124 [Karstenula rhodostoma CBS 690.94]
MENTQHREQVALIEAEHQQNLEAVLEAREAEADPDRLTVSFRPLIYFVKFHVQYLPMDADSRLRDCPICRESTSESHERMLQVDLPACKHIFGADCFERYIQRSHTCPMCREPWFEKRQTPDMSSPGARIEQIVIEVSVASDEAANSLLERLYNDEGKITRRLLGERVTELEDEEEDTEFESSATGEESDTSSQLEATRIKVTFRASTASGLDTEIGRGISRRARGDGSRSASDNEAATPPRRRRRYE